MNKPSTAKPQLLYAGECPKCRWISKMLIMLALGSMTRIPLDRAEAEQFYQDRPEARGRPALVEDGRMTYGWQVLYSVPRLLVRIWWQRLLQLLSRTNRSNSRPEVR